jgi:hypothetical protein
MMLHRQLFTVSTTGANQSRRRIKKGETLMKKTMTLALAASIFALTLAATPHRALAASNSYLTIDGIEEPAPAPQPSHQTTFWEGVCALFGF